MRLMVSMVGETFVRLSDGTCWPRIGGDKLDEHAHWLRYDQGKHSDNINSDAMMAGADAIGAYSALVDKPAARRAEIVRCLREAEEMEQGK